MTIRKEAPNGAIIKFPDGTSPETIEKYLALPKYQINEGTKNWDWKSDRNILTDMPLQAVGGVLDGINNTVGFIEGLGDTLGETTGIGGIVTGKAADNGIIGYKSHDQMKAEGIDTFLFGKVGVKDAAQLPTLDAPDTMAGGFTRGISTFMTGWFTGGKLAKGAGSMLGTKTAIKATQAVKANPIKTSLARGVVADTLAFDEHMGRMTDIIINYAPSTKDTWLGYLASDPNDTFWEGRMKNAIEGLALGGVFESVFRSYRYIKNKKDLNNGKKVDQQKLKQDEEFLQKQDPENLADVKQPELKLDDTRTPQVRIRGDATRVQTLNFDEVISQNWEKFKKGEIDLDASLDLGFNINSFRSLSKDATFQIQSLTKALEKQLSQIKQPQIMAILERRAERMYGGDIARVLKDGEELAGSLDKGRAVIMAHEVLTQSMLNLFPKMIRSYKAKQNGVTVEEVAQFQAILEKAFLNTSEIRTRWGQIGSIFQWGKDKTLGFDDVGVKFKQVVKDYKVYGGDYEKFLDQLASVKDVGSIPKIMKWVGTNKTWAVLNEVWINALLSSPKTHLINMTSNVINTFIRPLEVAIGSRMGTWMDNPAKVAMMKRQGGEAMSVFAGLFKYLDDVNTYTLRAFMNEDTVISGSGGRTKLDTPQRAVGDVKLFGKTIPLGDIVRTPTRFLNAEDEFFKQINGRAKLYQLAVKDAIEKGKSYDNIVGTNIKTKKGISEFEAHVSEYFRKGFDESNTVLINPDALRYAEEATFTQNLHGISKNVQDLVNKYPILKQVMPFVRTPMNLFKATSDRLPVAGLLRKEFRDDFLGKSGNPYRMAEARGKQAVGVALLTLASTVFKDRITGGEPESQYSTKLSKENKDLAKTALNFVPYSIRIGDNQYSFGRLDPFGAIIGIVADYNRYYDRLTEAELAQVGNGMNMMLWSQTGENTLPMSSKLSNFASASWSGLVRNAFSKTYLTSLMELVKVATSDDEATMKKWMREKVGSYIPNVYTKLVNDPYYRDTKTVFDNVKKRLGIETQVKYNFRGEPLKYSGDEGERMWRTMVNPLGTQKIKEDKVAEELIRLGQNVGSIKQFFKGTDVDLTQFVDPNTGQNGYDMLQELYRDTKVNKQLLDFINSPIYKTLTDPVSIDDKSSDKGQKFKRILDIIKNARKTAEGQLFKKLKTLQHIEDKKLSALVSYKRAVHNINYIKSGGRDKDRLYPLFKFSQ
jgi:hypothetical protein